MSGLNKENSASTVDANMRKASILTLIALAMVVLLMRPDQGEQTVRPAEAAETVEKPQPKVEKKRTLTLQEKIDQNFYKCKPTRIRADNAKCLPDIVERVASPVSTPVGCEHYRSLVAQYSWNVDTMMYAMQHESGCNPNAVGDNYVIGGIYAPSCGLLQVRTLAGRPSCEALKDPATNIATAYGIWQGQGYRAWSVLH